MTDKGETLFKLSFKYSSVLLACAVVVVTLFRFDEFAVGTEHKKKQAVVINSGLAGFSQQVLASAVRDIGILVNTSQLQNYAVSPTSQNQQELTSYLFSYARNNARYTQVRLLSLSGDELVRINNTPRGPALVPAIELQNKAHRDYVIRSQTLNPNQVYVSPIDVNIENRQIEQPYQPTVRLTKRLFDRQGQAIALVVLNLDAQSIMGMMRTTALLGESVIYLYNNSGYWQVEGEQSAEWHVPSMTPQFLLKVVEKAKKGEPVRHLKGDKFFFSVAPLNPEPFSESADVIMDSQFFLVFEKVDFDIAPPLDSHTLLVYFLTLFFPLLTGYTWANVTVTTRRQRANLHHQSIYLERVIENALDGIIVIDGKGIITEFNPTAEAIFGYKKSEVIKQNVKLLVPKLHAQHHDEYLQNYQQNHESRVLNKYRDLVALHKSGKAIYIRLAVSEMVIADRRFFVGSVSDITEFKKIEEERQAYNSRLEHDIARATQKIEVINQRMNLAINNGEMGVWELDIISNKIIWNDWMWRIHGMSPDDFDLTLDNWLKLVVKGDRKGVRRALRRSAMKGERFDLNFQLIWSNNEVRIVKAMASPVYDEHDQVTQIVGMLRDITDQVKAGEAREKARIQAEKVAQAKSAFLANMSHELRTPMNAVLGFTHLLARPEFTSEVRELAGKIEQSGQMLLHIINDILTFSKIDAGKLTLETNPFCLFELIDSEASVMSTYIGDKQLDIALEPNFDSDILLLGDRYRLQQILNNLISNAIKFTEQGKVVLKVKQLAREADEFDEFDKVTLLFTVSDTGIGLSAESQRTIFTEFEQADTSTTRRFGGTGLGLSITARLLSLMHSELVLTSALGKGSQFSFSLTFATVAREVPLFEGRSVSKGASTGASKPVSSSESTNESISASQSREHVLLVTNQSCVSDELTQTISILQWPVTQIDSMPDDHAAREQIVQNADIVIFVWRDNIEFNLHWLESMGYHNGVNKTHTFVMLALSNQIDEIKRHVCYPYIDHLLLMPLSPITLHRALCEDIDLEPANSESCATLDGVKLLIVDDTKINLDVAERIFTAEGAHVHCCDNARSALDYLHANPRNVDLVLMDIQMPHMDGYEAATKIRQDTRFDNIKIVALSAGALKSSQTSAHSAGMDDYISKPFVVADAVNKIRALITRKNEAEIVEVEVQRESLLDIEQEKPILNMETALSFWGDEVTLDEYLGLFLSQYNGVDALLDSDEEQARAELHKLKGSTGALGLDALYADTDALYEAMEEGTTTDELRERFKVTLVATMQYVEHRLNLQS